MSMKESVHEILTSFDQLSPEEQVMVTREIAKRMRRAHDENEGGPFGDEELTSLTDQMFQMYDREEERNGAA